MEPEMRSAGRADLKRGVRFQLTRTQMTPAKETALRAKTAPAPVWVVWKAATMRPPSAGPRARARLLEAALRETVSGMRSRGTSSGTMACHAGLFMAEPTLSRAVKARSVQGEMCPRKVKTASRVTEVSIQACQKMRSLRRSKMSAVAPARRPKRSTGRDAAVCMSAMSRGEAVSAVMSQVPAVSCIQVPTEETVDAIQRSRKSGIRRGAKPEVTAGGEASDAGGVLGEESGMSHLYFTFGERGLGAVFIG